MDLRRDTCGAGSPPTCARRALDSVAHDITLDDLPAAFDTLLKGQARGRFVVPTSSSG